MVEVNCETDFAAKDANFAAFADAVAEVVMNGNVEDVEALAGAPLRSGEATTVEEARQALVAKIGENMSVRRFVRMATTNGQIATYRHGVRIGVLVDLEGGSAELGKDLAMHIAASSPLCVDASGVPPTPSPRSARSTPRRPRRAASRQHRREDGRRAHPQVPRGGHPRRPTLRQGSRDHCRCADQQAGARVVAFRRFEVGEGIEKRQEDFAAEVAKAAAAVQG